MDPSSIRQTIVTYFGEMGKTPNDDTDLFEANVIDSMGLIELVTFIDQELQVEIGQDAMRLENFRTISDIVKTITRVG